MSYITHSGYGYSKKLCEDVTSWFVNTYYPRHKLDIDIVHRGLKCDKVIGLCDVNGPSSRPRAFLIDLQAHMENCLLYTSPSPRDVEESRMPSSA